MKKADSNHSREPESAEMLPEYDFRSKRGVRGKYYRAYRQGHTVKVCQNDGTGHGLPPDYVPVRIRELTATSSLFGVGAGPTEAGAEAKQAAEKVTAKRRRGAAEF
ncbi:MAG: hypothetical protein NTZ17_01245 [Phycisphaerae bacterium]|nr:hypothetical protein [Phycisphaerae bacterium]